MEIHTVTHTPTNEHMHPSHLGALISPTMKYVLRYAIQCCGPDAALLKHRVPPSVAVALLCDALVLNGQGQRVF